MRRLMVCLMVALLCFSLEGSSQNWNEWVRQKRTQIRYLVKQIAGLQAYIELGQQGYEIVQDGLGLINDVKHGDFNLHKGYFNSLSTVRVVIGKSAKVRAATGMYDDIRKQLLVCRKFVEGRRKIGNEYRAFFLGTLEGFSVAVEDNFLELQMLVSNGNYALTDDERLRRVDLIYAELAKQYRFIKTLYNDVVGVEVERQREMKEGEGLKGIHEIEKK